MRWDGMTDCNTAKRYATLQHQKQTTAVTRRVGTKTRQLDILQDGHVTRYSENIYSFFFTEHIAKLKNKKK
jgi:hypothetical protein